MGVTNRVFLALGTNLGQRKKNLQQAINALGDTVAIDLVSPIYLTSPWGIADQPDYFNACVAVTTKLSPLELLRNVKELEKKLGREPGVRWGPRLIDIDLIYFDQVVLKTEELTVPHPRRSERAFVLAPLNDIAADFVDPLEKRSVKELVAGVDLGSVKRLDGNEERLARPSYLAWGVKTFVMGIINVTPDSFSGDGLAHGDGWIEAAVDQAKRFVGEGADILDIGGESTRPGSQPITEAEEIDRVLPVIEAIRAAVDVPLSIDTYRAEVAAKALDMGANWINDVWALRMDPEMVDVARDYECPIVLMHNRSKPKNVAQENRLGGYYVGVEYTDLLTDVSRELQESINLALMRGVHEDQIIIDPGLGFGKTVSQNLQLLNELNELIKMGYPILVGPSRKSFIGHTLNLPAEDRLEGTAATVAIAIDRGADVIRVHDVGAMVRVTQMTDRVVR